MAQLVHLYLMRASIGWIGRGGLRNAYAQATERAACRRERCRVAGWPRHWRYVTRAACSLYRRKERKYGIGSERSHDKDQNVQDPRRTMLHHSSSVGVYNVSIDPFQGGQLRRVVARSVAPSGCRGADAPRTSDNVQRNSYAPA